MKVISGLEMQFSHASQIGQHPFMLGHLCGNGYNPKPGVCKALCAPPGEDSLSLLEIFLWLETNHQRHIAVLLKAEISQLR